MLDTKISDSYNTGAINPGSSSGEYAGGIVGYAVGGPAISGSHNTGSVNYANYGGGIAGYLNTNGIDTSYNTGTITSSVSSSNGGGIAGDASSSTISNSYNTGKITSYAQYSDGGGIVGDLMGNSSVIKSYNLGDVAVDSYAGGIVGTAYSSVIAQSYNTGNMKGSYAGGISGWLSGATVTDSYNIGEMNGKYDTGGIVAYGTNSTLKNCYNIGLTLYSQYSSVGGSGGIAGQFTGTLQNNYFLDTANTAVGNTTPDGTFQKSFDEMLQQATYSGFDFTNVWTMTGNADYHFPELTAAPQTGVQKTVSLSLKSPPQKLTYIQGDTFDVTGAVLTVKTNFGNTFDAGVKPEMVLNFNTNYIGKQSVSINYDSSAVAYVDVTVAAKDVTPPSKPTVQEVTDQADHVQGTAEAGSTVTVQVNGSPIGSITASTNGTYDVQIPVQKAGTSLSVTATDLAGNVSDAAIVVVTDVTPPAMPIVHQITDQDTTASGTSEPDSVINVYLYNNVIATGKTGSDGNFSFAIPLQHAGNQLYFTAIDSAGNPSEPSLVVVKDVTKPAIPAVNPVNDQDTLLSGTAEPLSMITIENSGTVIGTGQVGNNGYFSIPIPQQKVGDTLVVTATDEARNVSDGASIIVTDGTPPAAPTIDNLTNHDTALTGTAEPGSTVIAQFGSTELGRAIADTDGKYAISIAKQQPGAIIYVHAVDKAGNIGPNAQIIVSSKLQTVIGDTRYSTAVDISIQGWKTSDTVFLVNGSAIVDGLTATPLASAKNAPILLTRTDSLPAETINEIQRLQAKNIILIGGTGVISTQVEDSLKSQGYSVDRIGGSDRYETSLLIAKQLSSIVDVKTAFVAYGRGEPDALSIAAQAGQRKQPIILTDKTALPADTFNWLKTQKLSDAYFIGGSQVIDPLVMDQFNTITSTNVNNNRISGQDRNETNAKVIEKFYTSTQLPAIMVAKSQTDSLVDALTAGPLAAKWGVPVLLASQTGLQQSQINVVNSKQIKLVYQIGGGINSSVINQVVQ